MAAIAPWRTGTTIYPPSSDAEVTLRLQHDSTQQDAQLEGNDLSSTVEDPWVKDQATLRKRFDALVAEWYQAHDKLSSMPVDWIMCMPYQQIIGQGPAVIPLLLRELQERPNHWFWALRVITNADPVPEESRGNFDDMVSNWLSWGRDNGYL